MFASIAAAPARQWGSPSASARRFVIVMLIAALSLSIAGFARLVNAELSPRSVPAADAGTLSTSDWQQLNDLVYAAQPRGTLVEFGNRAHGLSATLRTSGANVSTTAGHVTIALEGLSRGSAFVPAASAGAVTAKGVRAEMAHRAGPTGVTEWWVNRASGLEQGFTIDSRPAGEGGLRLLLTIGGSLTPLLAASDTVAFTGSDLRYSGLTVWDAAGRHLGAHFELDKGSLAIVVDDAAATYPVTIDPTFDQQTYFKASNTDALDEFGDAVAIDGDTMVVGASFEDSDADGVNGNQADNSALKAGAAYVFVRDDFGVWAQQAYLKASNSDADDEFGHSVGISGDTIVVGAHYEASNATGINGDEADDTLFRPGAAYVFTRTGTTWSQQAYLKASNTDGGDEFGHSVAVDGDTVVVGAPEEDSVAEGINGDETDDSLANSGAAYVFTRSGATWTQQAYVKASNSVSGARFGFSIALDGDTLAVGARGEGGGGTGVDADQNDQSAPGSGAAYVLTRSGSTWSQQAYIKASNTDSFDSFGWSIDVDGDTLVVGADAERSNATGVDGDGTDDSLVAAGAAYVYTRSGSTWSHDAYLKASNTGAQDQFGESVAVDNGIVAIGARGEASAATGIDGDQADNSAAVAGAVYVFGPSGTTWQQLAYVKASNTDAGDTFGTAVALSGDRLIAGASSEDSAGTGVNGPQDTFPVANSSGAVYEFVIAPEFVGEAYLKESNTDAGDKFGTSVSISGDTVVVGAPWEQSTNGLESNDSGAGVGAAYVFVRSGTTWSQQAYLKASNMESGDNFGHSVAISGDTIVVGAFGEGGRNTGVNSIPNDIGASNGAAYVFTRSGTTWSQQAYLKPTTTDDSDFFGQAVAISGDTVVVGSWGEDSGANGVNGNQALNGATDAGAAWVFERSGTSWTQQAYLKASNSNAGDHFGWSVAASGDTIVVGADDEASADPNNQGDNSAGGTGAAYVFTRSAGVWTQQAYLKASNLDGSDNFGFSVGIAGNNIIVGAPNEDSGTVNVYTSPDELAANAGAAYIFHRSGTTWSEQSYVKAFNTDPSDTFGYSVSIGVDTAVVGARAEASNSTEINGDMLNDSAFQAGAAYLYSRIDGVWMPEDYIKPYNTDGGDLFGHSVSISNDTVVAGSPEEDSVATGINGDGTDDTALGAGAAYVGIDEGCIGAPFTDVATDHPFCPEIRWMEINEISTGFDDGTYRPSIDVTRQAMSAFMARLAGATLTACAVPPFTDVPTNHPFCEEIQWMKDEGISEGFDDGTYRPSLDVTRQAMSAFMARLADAELPACVVAPFSDVPVAHPFCEEIAWMKRTGVSTGFSDGTYRPSIDVTRQAMSAFLYRVSVFAR